MNRVIGLPSLSVAQIALASMLVLSSGACSSSDSAPGSTSLAGQDDASADGAIGTAVAAAAGDPAIEILTPQNNANFTHTDPTDIDFQVSVKNGTVAAGSCSSRCTSTGRRSRRR